MKRIPTPQEVAAKARVHRKVGLFVLGLVTPGALSFALETLYAGNAPWEWFWSLSFVGLCILARPSCAAATATFAWITLFFFIEFLNVDNLYIHFGRDEDSFLTTATMIITLTAFALGISTAVAGAIHTGLARRRNPAPVTA